MLPQILLEPGQYQVVLLSEDTRNLISGYPILPFSLAAAGDQLYLCSTDAVVDYLNIPRLEQDTAYGRGDSGTPGILADVTPAAEKRSLSEISPSSWSITYSRSERMISPFCLYIKGAVRLISGDS